MTNHSVAVSLKGTFSTLASLDGQSVLAASPPDPEPGWASLHPDLALAFLYVSPRPGTVIDELLALTRSLGPLTGKDAQGAGERPQ